MVRFQGCNQGRILGRTENGINKEIEMQTIQ
jgi:hypothetical protein